MRIVKKKGIMAQNVLGVCGLEALNDIPGLSDGRQLYE